MPPHVIFEDGTIKKTGSDPRRDLDYLYGEHIAYMTKTDFANWGEEEIVKLFECFCKSYVEWICCKNFKFDYTYQLLYQALQKWTDKSNRFVPDNLRHMFLIHILQKASTLPSEDAWSALKRALFISTNNRYYWPEIPNAYAIAQYLNKYQGDVTFDQIIEVLNEQAKMLGYETVDLNRQDNQELAD
jgi:hypothetical protein